MSPTRPKAKRSKRPPPRQRTTTVRQRRQAGPRAPAAAAPATKRRLARAPAEHKRLNAPDETRTFAKGKLELVKMGGGVVGRLTLEPGWRWSEHVKPIAGTQSCEAPHFQYHVSGRIRIRMDDGTEFEAGPGDVTALPSGHDAWVVGDEPVVVVDWHGAREYAKR
jgi:quercetin dioxygenase-like cupin family protein